MSKAEIDGAGEEVVFRFTKSLAVTVAHDGWGIVVKAEGGVLMSPQRDGSVRICNGSQPGDDDV